MTKFRVGQIVYVLNNDTQSITSAQIITENKQKTLKGTIISYDAQLSTKMNDDPWNINDANVGNVFESSKKLRDYLIANATRAIQSMVEDAEKQSLCFQQDVVMNDDDEDVQTVSTQGTNDIIEQPKDDDGTQLVKVRMSDGSVELVRM
jgi:hypothetical protein